MTSWTHRSDKLRGEEEHEEGRILLCWGSLHYSQAWVPAMRFIYGPNKVEQNILCTRRQSGLLWLEMKLKMCLRVCGGGRKVSDQHICHHFLPPKSGRLKFYGAKISIFTLFGGLILECRADGISHSCSEWLESTQPFIPVPNNIFLKCF